MEFFIDAKYFDTLNLAYQNGRHWSRDIVFRVCYCRVMQLLQIQFNFV